MIAAKEHLVPLEHLARRQEQIFPDACDVGLWDRPEDRRIITSALAGLHEVYRGVARTWDFGASWSTFLPVEVDDGETQGIMVEVSFNRVRGQRGGFFSITIFRLGWEQARARMGEKARAWESPFQPTSEDEQTFLNQGVDNQSLI